VLSNTELAELLARQAERESGILARAFRRAARAAFLWPEEVSQVAAQNRSLTRTARNWAIHRETNQAMA